MKQNDLIISKEALTMRHEFDLGFTQLPRPQTATPINFLGIYLGNDAFAIPATDITGLHINRRIMPMPSPVPTMLGISRFRGLITPVYDLAALLGYKRMALPRWLMLVRLNNLNNLNESVALAFENFESFFSAEPSSIISAPQLPISTPDNARTHLCDAIRFDGNNDTGVRPIIHLQSLLNSLQQSQQPPLQKGVNNHA